MSVSTTSQVSQPSSDVDVAVLATARPSVRSCRRFPDEILQTGPLPILARSLPYAYARFQRSHKAGGVLMWPRDDARILGTATMPTKREATVEDLYRVPGKAELVNGELVLMPLSGDAHGYAVLEIAASLREFGRRTKAGRAFGDNVGFLVNLPHRRSFSPDAGFYTGQPFGAKFIEGAPIFAVEVRSEEDYGPAAERAMAAKRADYFAAGTHVVWDVDVLREACVRVYRAPDPENPTIYRRGELAEAEPAVPGWTFAADDLFLPDAN